MAQTYFQLTMASAGTSTPSVDLDGLGFRYMYLEIPSMTSNSQHFLQVSSDNTTFRRLTQPPVNTSSIQTNDFNVGSAVTNRIVPIFGSFRYVKVESTATIDSGALYKIIVSK